VTTVAYKDGVLAGDTRECAGGLISPGRLHKVHRLPDGSLFGLSGSVENSHVLLNALLQNTHAPELEDIEAIHVHTDGSLWRFESKIWVPLDMDFYAIGSGTPYALVAMRWGASAVEAVEEAMNFDAFTGGEVLAVSLEPRKPKTRAKKRKGK
jgi:ATP-dependent protease HslVU (ClpYQ) peptidase subunit